MKSPPTQPTQQQTFDSPMQQQQQQGRTDKEKGSDAMQRECRMCCMLQIASLMRWLTVCVASTCALFCFRVVRFADLLWDLDRVREENARLKQLLISSEFELNQCKKRMVQAPTQQQQQQPHHKSQAVSTAYGTKHNKPNANKASRRGGSGEYDFDSYFDLKPSTLSTATMPPTLYAATTHPPLNNDRHTLPAAAPPLSSHTQSHAQYPTMNQ